MSMSEVGFSSEAPDELRQYRSLSKWSLIAAVVALLSPLALVHALLACIPLVAVGLAFIALRVITADQVGRSLAYFALAMGVLFLALGPSRHITRHATLHADARRFAADWLDILAAGRFEEAHQLTLPYFDREPADIALADFYANPFSPTGLPTEAQSHGPFTELEEFKSFGPFRWEGGFTHEFEGVAPSRGSSSDTDTAAVIFRLTSAGGSESLRLEIVMERFVQQGTAYWRVLNHFDPDFVIPTINQQRGG